MPPNPNTTTFEQGYFRQIFTDAMERLSRNVNDGTVVRVGVNSHAIPEDEDHLLKDTAETKIEPSRQRVDWMRDFKRGRDQEQVRKDLGALHDAGRDHDRNLMQPFLAAMETGATAGEMAGFLRQAYGLAYDPFGHETSPLETRA